MTLTPSRPVPEASSEEQQRLEVELLVGEPVLQATELQTLGQDLLFRGKGLPEARWRELGALPLQDDKGRLVVAVPSNWGAQQRQNLSEELQRAGFNAELKLALATNLTAALTAKAPTPAPAASKPAQPRPPASFNPPRSLTKDLGIPGTSEGQLQEVADVEDLEGTAAAASSSANASPIISLVDRILIEALTSGASDIHVEPQENTLEIRFRLDGVLQKHFEDLPKSLTPAVTSRIKIMAELDIAERRLPQEGRIRRMFRGRKMDFRVSTLPSRNGEKICLRLLDSGATQLGLETLITDADARRTLRELGSKPYGMILVTGPTGSGKSTTLYALLAERNDPGINISTVEDPIEYTLHGITQTQVNREKGLDFSMALRAFMRQDPDVLLVGETRDLETAKTAIEAALTGHLVMTTLHCNDAASAIARLDEMGVEPFMVSASLLGIVSQRLLRRVCSACRISYTPNPEELARFGLLSSHETTVTFFKANTQNRNQQGCCPACNGAGYKGRIGVYEILRMTDTLAAAVAKRQPTDVLRRMALENGMKTLLGYGLQLVREGHTTLAEVERMLLTDSGLESERRSKSLSTLTCSNCGAGLHDDWLECPYCLTSR
ncbi:type II/IV secretion system protein [Cyanobium sp. WKJ7-Wakatipu]|uniref:GspE/PulE family protein n=1 Tax=Cyanobium sp. WKJ7-Wakatipu TaxID=2823726 RepID=UPI0020CC045B|nr:GspE/PulE family protein [Cyanobium sp. WKJ7-Wakatipu]MCP9783762.1 type II/IV secretion system protein [Cyanobium sp. WKJ7-Wakatipu]